MNRKNSSGSGMFLMEMIVVVGFFIFCASICILAYARSDHASGLAVDRNQAVSAAQSMVEVWKLSDEEDTAEHTAYWDGDWAAVPDPGQAQFHAQMKVETEAGGMSTAQVTVYRDRDDEELFSLEAKKYRGGNGDGRW